MNVCVIICARCQIMRTAIKQIKAMYVYEILLEANKPLSRKEIFTKLKNVYGIDESEKTLTEFLRNLMDADLITAEAQKRESNLKNKTGYEITDTTIYTNYSLKERPLNDKELLWLIDNAIFSKQLSESESKSIVSKLLKLGSKSLKDKVRAFGDNKHYYHSSSNKVSTNIDILSSAIKSAKSITFTPMEYGIDLKLHPYVEVNTYIKPLRLIPKNDFYYVIAFEPESNSLQHYRIDLMCDISIANENIDYDSINNRINIEEYLSTHSLMRSGEAELVRIRLREEKIGLVIDRFSKNISLEFDDEDYMIVTLKSNPDDLYIWALENGEYVEVIEPQHIRNRLRVTVNAMSKKYTFSDDDNYYDKLEYAKKYKEFRCYHYPLTYKKEWLEINDLRILTLWNSEIDNIDFIKKFPNIKEIELLEKNLKDISALNCHSKLKSLELLKTQVSDLSVLANMEIKTLKLLKNNSIEDYSPIYEIKGLENLWVDPQAAEKINMDLFKYSTPRLNVLKPLNSALRNSNG